MTPSLTLSQRLTKEVLHLHLNPGDAETAAAVSALSESALEQFKAADKPMSMTLSRATNTISWLVKAVASPVVAAAMGHQAAQAMGALTATLDPVPMTYTEKWLADGPLPLDEVAAEVAKLAKEGAKAGAEIVTSPFVDVLKAWGPWALGAYALVKVFGGSDD